MPSQHLTFDTKEYSDPQIVTLMRQRGIIRLDESVADVFQRVVGTLITKDAQLDGRDSLDLEFIEHTRELVEQRTIAFGTPILAGVGRNKETSSACTVIDVPERSGKVSWHSLTSHMTNMLSAGLGTGIDLSELDEPAKVLTELNEYIDELNIKLIQDQRRPVACMATLRADHPRILDFIRVKKNADFSRWHFNVSVWVQESHFSHDEDSELLDEIVESAHFCAEPGILFFDRHQRDNPTPNWKYSSVAPCGELAMASGEACQFSYINLTHLVKKVGKSYTFDWEVFSKTARVLTRLLDASVQMSGEYHSLRLDRVLAKRRIGIGVTGFAGLLINLNIPYASPAATLLASQISETLDYYTKIESVELAKRRGSFPIFQQSLYAQPKWVARKLERTSGVIDEKSWKQLNQEISTRGIRHASTTSFAPTGTSSRIVQATPQFEPCYNLEQVLIDHKLRARLVDLISPTEYNTIKQQLLENDSSVHKMFNESHVLATARQIHYTHHIAIQAAFQSFADDATSKTINLPNEASVDDVKNAMFLAFEKQLKGLTIFRDGCLDERDPCQIDSGFGCD